MLFKQVEDRHKDILNKLAENSIFTLEELDGSVTIREACDGFCNIELSKDDCIQLSNLFKDLSEVIRLFSDLSEEDKVVYECIPEATRHLYGNTPVEIVRNYTLGKKVN